MRVRIESVTDHNGKAKHQVLIGCERYISIGKTMSMTGEGVANRVHTSTVIEKKDKRGMIWVKTLNTIYVLKKLGI